MNYFESLTEVEKVYIASKILKKRKETLIIEGIPKNQLLEKIAFIYKQKQTPLSKIFREKYFWDFKFYTSHYCLDPRPHTESIIEMLLKNHSTQDNFSFIDLGTGSGVIACTVCLLFPNAFCTAIDISNKALKVARKNIRKFNLENRIKLIKSNWLENINDRYDILISNPPYLTVEEAKNESIQKDPKISLTAGEDTNKMYKLISEKQNLFKEIYLEVPPIRKKEIQKLFTINKVFLV